MPRRGYNDISRNLYIEPSNLELGDWIWAWLKNYKQNTTRPNTYARYISLMKLHIAPYLGKIKLKNLKSLHIQSLYNQLIDEVVSPSTLKHVHTVFNQSLTQAIHKGLLFSNPVVNTVRSKPKKTEVKVLSVEQPKTLFDGLENNAMGVLIKLAICSYGRMGELLALRWFDIDFKEKTMHIRNKLTPVYKFDEDGKNYHFNSAVQLSDLKTANSKRDIF